MCSFLTEEEIVEFSGELVRLESGLVNFSAPD